MLAELGKEVYIGKMDIKSAFRLLSINPADFDLLGIKIAQKYYIDKCLPMGCSLSCKVFEGLPPVCCEAEEWFVYC